MSVIDENSTAADLKLLASEILKQKCLDLNLSVTGYKSHFITRILDYFNPTGQQKETIVLLAARLQLEPNTVKDLNKHNFTLTEQLQNMCATDLDAAVPLLKDRVVLRELLFPKPTELPVPPVSHHARNGDTHRGSKCRRSRSTSRSRSGSGESSRTEHVKSSKTLSLVARDLPRPHTFVYARALMSDKSRSSSKIHPLQLGIYECFAGCSELSKQLAGSPKHSATLAEFLDYVNYLNHKQRDYKARAILEFDDAFRQYADFHHCSLSDIHARDQVGLQHFGQRNLLPELNDHFNNRVFDRNRLGTNDFHSNGKRRGTCNNWNFGFPCQAQQGRECPYLHKCAKCRGPHKETACTQPDTRRQ